MDWYSMDRWTLLKSYYDQLEIDNAVRCSTHYYYCTET